MAYQVLARKWRPKRFQDVIGQLHITNSIQNAIVRERLGHAYILTGTRGIGKTSVARIFAKALRCENRLEDGNPCLTCPSCLESDSGSSMNVMEIDGASNNSVDDIRELINNVHYLPTTGKYKIYIIDEVHMLSTNAFNALLKTLEEPPEHVMFIFATTEPHKMLGTVLSRCQRFDFRNASVNDLVEHVEKIAKEEGINFQNKRMIRQICRQGKGSVRDTLSLVDQVLSFSSENTINEEAISVSLGLTSTTALYNLATGMFSGNLELTSNTYREMLNENVPVKNIVTSFLDHLFEIIENIDSRETLKSENLINPDVSDELSTAELLWVFETLGKEATWILDSVDPEKLLEILLHKLTLRRDLLSVGNAKIISKSSASVEIPQPTSENIEKKTEELSVNEEQPVVEEVQPVVEEVLPIAEEVQPEIQDEPKDWEAFLVYLKKENSATATYLEHGNIVKPMRKTENGIEISYAFPDKDRVMYDHIMENRDMLLTHLSNFFEVDENEIEFEAELILEKDREDSSFRSKVEIIEEEIEIEQNKKREELATDDLIQKAEDLFNTKVDKIILNKD
ncbi:MAG: DNA polymerase III subunit gamma/tau [Bacteriovoracaceae bacterium]|nr:DNA polymerase III subunit gamma/tau [Bacteriovoracaceae bacterium]